MDDISEQLERRDLFRKHRWEKLSPSERLAQMDALQHRAWYILKISEEGRARFFKRNFKARVTDSN
jgi:hypothetical protein